MSKQKVFSFFTQQAREVWDVKTLIHRPLATIELRLQHRKEDFHFLQKLAIELEAKLSRILIEEDDELVESLWHAFLKGYTEVRPLSESDQAAVSLMTVIRQLWLMGLCMHDPHIMGSSDSDDAFVSEKMEFFKKYFA